MQLEADLCNFERSDEGSDDVFQETLMMLVVQPYADKLEALVDSIFLDLNLNNQVLRSYKEDKKQSKKSAKRGVATAKSHPNCKIQPVQTAPIISDPSKAPQASKQTQTDTDPQEYSKSIPNGQIHNNPAVKMLMPNQPATHSLLKKRTFSCNFQAEGYAKPSYLEVRDSNQNSNLMPGENESDVRV